MWAGVLGGQRGCAGTQGIHECACVCACEPEECYVCACTSDLLSLPAQEEKETWLSVLVFYVSPVRRCC